jgi:hypothetical protein
MNRRPVHIQIHDHTGTTVSIDVMCQIWRLTVLFKHKLTADPLPYKRRILLKRVMSLLHELVAIQTTSLNSQYYNIECFTYENNNGVHEATTNPKTSACVAYALDTVLVINGGESAPIP